MRTSNFMLTHRSLHAVRTCLRSWPLHPLLPPSPPQAHRHYEHLKVLGRERSGLDDVKLNAHVSFCAAQLQKVGGMGGTNGGTRRSGGGGTACVRGGPGPCGRMRVWARSNRPQ